MNSIYSDAFSLLGVGMVTVFFILWIVVIIGSSIIAFINRFFPETSGNSTTKTVQPTTEKAKMAAIVAAVKIATGGKANIISIDKK